MLEGVEIRGGAGEFEAAVIAIVLDRIASEEAAVRSRLNPRGAEVPAWVRAMPQQTPLQSRRVVTPDGL